jgi:hypothetical protein
VPGAPASASISWAGPGSETPEHAVVGTITLPHVQRVSDALNSRDRDFIALSDVFTYSKADGSEAAHAFLAVSRRHIVLASALGDASALGGQNALSGLAARLLDRAFEARRNGTETAVTS